MGYSISQEMQSMKKLHERCQQQECTFLDYFHRMRIPVLDYLLAVYAANLCSEVITVENIYSQEQLLLVNKHGAEYAEQRTYEDLEKLIDKDYNPMHLRDMDVKLNSTIIGLLVRKGLVQKMYFHPVEIICAAIPTLANRLMFH